MPLTLCAAVATGGTPAQRLVSPPANLKSSIYPAAGALAGGGACKAGGVDGGADAQHQGEHDPGAGAGDCAPGGGAQGGDEAGGAQVGVGWLVCAGCRVQSWGVQVGRGGASWREGEKSMRACRCVWAGDVEVVRVLEMRAWCWKSASGKGSGMSALTVPCFPGFENLSYCWTPAGTRRSAAGGCRRPPRSTSSTWSSCGSSGRRSCRQQWRLRRRQPGSRSRMRSSGESGDVVYTWLRRGDRVWLGGWW